MPADPVVSPADTRRYAQKGVGWLRKMALTQSISARAEEFERMAMAVEALLRDENERAALLAVGERDKAERDAAIAALEPMAELNAALIDARERDRQQIARLTEALDARPITREHAFRAAQNAVRNQGYAVALHGSQIKDLDLIAVPWQETALTAQDVAELIAAAIPGFIEKGSPEAKPNGRLSFTIRPNWHYGFDHWWIDLAVMPRECDWPARAVLAGEEDARP